MLRTPGVLTVVRNGDRPALLDNEFIVRLREAIERDGATPETISDSADGHPGLEVIVQDGVLAGPRGVVQERRSRRQLVIWVAAIGRGIAFTIGQASVKAVT